MSQYKDMAEEKEPFTPWRNVSPNNLSGRLLDARTYEDVRDREVAVDCIECEEMLYEPGLCCGIDYRERYRDLGWLDDSERVEQR